MDEDIEDEEVTPAAFNVEEVKEDSRFRNDFVDFAAEVTMTALEGNFVAVSAVVTVGDGAVLLVLAVVVFSI